MGLKPCFRSQHRCLLCAVFVALLGPAGVALADTGDSAPSTLCDPHSFGARGDGQTKDTAAIQRAVDVCVAAGGGTVVLRDGVFLSGTITLGSNIVLRIAPGATLLGSRDDADYPTLQPAIVNSQLDSCQHALIYVPNASHVRIEGGGTVDGNADFARWRGMSLPERARPMAIFTVSSNDIAIEGVTVRNAATWAVVNMEVAHLYVGKLTIETALGPTHDGIDVVDGHDVLIEDNTITSGDDAICLKSGSATGLQDIIVRNNRILGAGVANGLKIGTASVGPIRRLLFEDISIANAQAAAMAVESVDGSAISDLVFRRIQVSQVGTPFFVLLGSRSGAPVGSISSVHFASISARALRYPWGSLLSGAATDAAGPHALQDITFTDLDLRFPGSAAVPDAHHFSSSAQDASRFPLYQGGYPDPKFLFATPTAKSEVTDYSLPGWAFFFRHARAVHMAHCQLTLDAGDTRAAVATHDAVVDGHCAQK